MASERTIKFRRLTALFTIVSLLLNIAPLAFYTIKALIDADLTHEKVALSMTVFIVLIMTVVSIANKIVLKSRIWIIMLGIYICLDTVLTPLIIIAVCQIVDELLITPLKKNFKSKKIINKEMDKRL